MQILVADSGATKTEWWLGSATNPEADIVQLITPGINPTFMDAATIKRSILDHLSPQLPSTKIDFVHFYGAGCSGDSKINMVADVLRDVLGATNVEVQHDMLGAARALCGDEKGIACILGTGSNSCMYDGEKIVEMRPNLGFWLGDEGGGGYLGKQLLKDFFHDLMPAELRQDFAERYKLTREQIIERMYKQPNPNSYAASLAPFVYESLGTQYARNLVNRAFSKFIEIYLMRYPRYKMYPVHAVGSIAYFFRDFWETALEQHGLMPGTVQRSPAEYLYNYHLKHLQNV